MHEYSTLTPADDPEYLHPVDPTPQTPTNATITPRDAPATAKSDRASSDACRDIPPTSRSYDKDGNSISLPSFQR